MLLGCFLLYINVRVTWVKAFFFKVVVLFSVCCYAEGGFVLWFCCYKMGFAILDVSVYFDFRNDVKMEFMFKRRV